MYSDERFIPNPPYHQSEAQHQLMKNTHTSTLNRGMNEFLFTYILTKLGLWLTVRWTTNCPSTAMETSCGHTHPCPLPPHTPPRQGYKPKWYFSFQINNRKYFPSFCLNTFWLSKSNHLYINLLNPSHIKWMQIM